LPAGVQFGADLIAWWAFTVFLIGRFGKIELAAHNICFKFLEIAFMPAVGLGFALTAVVGRSIGEGRRDIARRYVTWALRFMVGYMGLIGLAMAVFRHELPALLTDNDQVVRAAAPLMMLCAVFQAFDAMGITFNRALHGAGDTFWPAVLFVLSVAVILIGGGWLMATLMPQWKSVGPWLAATVHLFLIGMMLWARYRFGPWERIEL
jgi:MATE family multidrug resistance protein